MIPIAKNFFLKIFEKLFIWRRILSQYPAQWGFALISFVCILGDVCKTARIYFCWGRCSLSAGGSERLRFVSSPKAVRQIRQGALSARLQEGFSLRMEQLNNCSYLQWTKWRSILRTIRKGKVIHPAGKSLSSHILLRERECLVNVNS